MNIETGKLYTIYRKDFDGVPKYKIMISQQNLNGSVEHAYMPVKLKKGLSLEEGENKVYLRSSWIKFYKKKEIINGADYIRDIYYLFINDFITQAQRIEETRPDFDNMATSKTTTQIPVEKDPYEDFGEQVEIKEEDLPF
jgi:hypothetical protein